jgi:ABC-type polysaccharide/polyol phosphate export permease
MTTVTNRPTNRIGLTSQDYQGGTTTLCAGCGHNSVTSQIIAACYDLSLDPRQVVILINKFNIYSILVYPWMVFTAFYLFPFLRYLSMSNVLLKDISPIIRLFLQFGFWTLPIIYFPPSNWGNILQYHPLLPFLEIFRAILLPEYFIQLDYMKIIIYFIISYLFLKITSLKFKKMIPDHL